MWLLNLSLNQCINTTIKKFIHSVVKNKKLHSVFEDQIVWRKRQIIGEHVIDMFIIKV